jgi:hypothetical protein
MIESAYNVNLFLNNFHFKSHLGYWLPLVSVEEIARFPVYVYSYSTGRSRSIWFGGTIEGGLSVLKGVVHRSTYYLYEVFRGGRYSCEMTFSKTLDCRLGCVEEFWMRRSR